jgi:hypothetical protein
MIVQSVESKIWWLIRADEVRAIGGIPIVRTVQRLVQQFEFAQAPTSLPGPNDGLKFQEGRFAINDRAVAIKEMIIFNDGVSIELYSTTEDNFRCLEVVLQVGTELGLRPPQTAPNVLLQSMIVVDFKASIDKIIGGFDDVSRLINENIGIEGKHHLRGFEFNIDPTTLPAKLAPFNPTVFRIERRLQVEYAANRYFSFANANTANHLVILEKLEALSN